MSKQKKVGYSKMAVSSEDERESVLPFLHRKYRTPRETGFNKGEILERADLFKDEYNQEDIHDRVLVLQVMPDDYEMRELTARLELSTAVNEETTAVYGESASEMLTSELCDSSDTISVTVHTENNVLRQSVIGLDCAAKDGQHYSKGDAICTKREALCNRDGIETNIYYASRSHDIADEGDSRHNTETVSYWNESKTERSDVRCDRASEGQFYARETNKTNCPDLVHHIEALHSTTKDSSEAIDHFESDSMSEKPIPRPRTFFQDVNQGFPENERELNAYTVREDAMKIESGSTKDESAIACSERTVREGVECATELGARNGAESSAMVDENYVNASARVCEVHMLREHRIYVHACWLALNSRYFRSLLFESGMRECTSAEFCMKVAESEEDAFLLLVRSIYDPNVLDTLEITQVLNVLRLSVKYDVRFSTVKAKRVLEAMPLTLDVCESIIVAVNSGGLPNLSKVMKNVENILLSEFEPLDETWESEKFATLSEHALRFLLGSDRLIVQSENTVFIALMQWIATNAELYEDITEYSDLLNLVRFELMKPTYIHDVVRGHEIATQLDDFDAVYLNAITYHALPQKRRGEYHKQRNWCPPKSPTFMWILYPEPELFSFDEETSSNSTQSSSFWYLGYKMHLRLDLSTCQDESCLYLVVENLVDDGSVEIVYEVDVKFGDGLHNSFTCDPFVYRGNDLSSPPGNYPFDEKYSLGEIKEILLGSPIKVAITFEVTLEKLLNY